MLPKGCGKIRKTTTSVTCHSGSSDGMQGLGARAYCLRNIFMCLKALVMKLFGGSLGWDQGIKHFLVQSQLLRLRCKAETDTFVGKPVSLLGLAQPGKTQGGCPQA